MMRRRAAPRFDDKRSPEVRLEALVKEPGVARSHRIFQRIRQELDGAPAPGPWIAAARSLGAQGLVSEDAVIYLVEIFLECVTSQSAETDPAMLRLGGEMQRIEREHGLAEHETWLLYEAPAEWLAVNAQWDRRDYALRAAVLRSLGHHELAELLEDNPDEFDRRATAGHCALWGPIDDEG